MPEIFPQRHSEDHGNDLIDICRCGHAEHLHGFGDGQCHECLCPEYKFEQKLTQLQAIDLRIRLLQEYDKKGLKQ